MKTILDIARDCEKSARDTRTCLMHTNITKQGEIQTLRYCGAMLSLVASTLTELDEKLRPVFDKNVVNGILREWGAEELM